MLKVGVGEIEINGSDHEYYTDFLEGGGCIGGDRGDLIFDGFRIEDDVTTLSGCVFATHMAETKEELLELDIDAKDEAEYILAFALR